MTGLSEAQTVPHRGGGRRATLVIVVVVVAIAVIGLALWLADGLVRGMAQDGVEDALESKLPDTVDADLEVSIGGGFFLPQLIAGTFNDVTVAARDAEVGGIPFDIVVTAHGVPLDENGTIDETTAVVTGGEDAANALLALGGADPQLSLGDGTLSYDQSSSFLGFAVGYTLVTEPTAHGDSVSLTPVDVRVATDVGNLDLTAFVNNLLGNEPVTVCVASSLPEGISVDDIDVTPEELTLTLSATDMPRNGPDLDSRGSCDAS
ncbi:LmeA family phospholipid-binding protein [Paramicrobacterium fandaimingii]|uniref:LmeA family phospholipid-binding protein n=1 Tax=Paramicrobacterium fandaimingii TaxID=2708079 RepID=UPI0014218D70|nr:DUF2993 domain-containing protein [Microbacterium fandaimingii]